MKKNIICSLLLASCLFADNSVVIYNNGLALFDINSKLGDIKKGENNLIYSNISPNIISNSVSVIFPNKVNLLEQNFKYDLINHNNILKNFIDKEITYNDYENSVSFKKSKATLLSVEGVNCVIKDTNNNIKVIPSKDIIVSSIPEGMITKPSLLFRINSSDDISNPDIFLRYLSIGFSWSSDYVATIVDNNLFINGWISLKNDSDVSLKNYDLKLLAGDVNSVDNFQKPQMMRMNMMAKSSVMEADAVNVTNKEFSGYHIYKIPFKVDIDKKSSKQINFLNINTDDWNKYNEIDLYYGEVNNAKFNQVISFKNNKESGLGEPLPAGVIRFYQKDLIDNSSYFIGSSNLSDTPKDEVVKLIIGQNFDSVIDVKIIDSKFDSTYTNQKSYLKVKFDIRNNGDKKEVYKIKQNNPIVNTLKANTYIKSENCLNNDKCSYKEISDSIIEFSLKLNPKEKYSFEAIFSNYKN